MQLQSPTARKFAAYPGMTADGLVQGPGTGTSDTIPAALSDGEVVIPSDKVSKFGAAAILAMVDQGGAGLPKPKVKNGTVHAAVGGLIQDPMQPTPPSMPAIAPGAVTRVGNSYSGGSVSGPITVNGQTPAGTTSYADPYGFAATPAPAPAPAIAAPATSLVPRVPGAPSVLSPTASPIQQPGVQATPASVAPPPPAPAPAAPTPAPAPVSMDRNAEFFAGAEARNAAARQPVTAGRRLAFAGGGLATTEDLRQLATPRVDAMGRRPAIDMGMAERVYPSPATSAAGAVQSPGSPAPAGNPMGRMGPIDMGMAERVYPTPATVQSGPPSAAGGAAAAAAPGTTSPNAGLRLGTPTMAAPTNPNFRGGASPQAQAWQASRAPAAAAAAAEPVSMRAGMAAQPSRLAAGAYGLGRTLGAAGRAAGPVGAAIGVADEGMKVAQVARDPNASGVDVATQASEGAGRLGAAGAGAALGASLGSVVPVVGTALGGIAGGVAGYYGADKLIGGLRSLAGVDPSSPVDRIQAPVAPVATTANLGEQADVRRMDNAVAAGAGGVGGAGGGFSRSGNSFSDGGALPGDLSAAQRMALGVDNGGVGYVGAAGVSSQDRIAQDLRAAANSRALGERSIELARQGVTGWTPGMGVIGPVDYANRNAAFNEGAALRSAAAQMAWSPRRGFQANDAAIAAAGMPVRLRARAEEVAAEQSGANTRAEMVERAANARTALADLRAQDANDIARAHLGIEAVRAGQGNLPAGYERAPGGGLQYIKGGPADPNTPKGKNSLTDSQSKALLFGSRMQAANKILNDLQADGKVYSTPGANVPYVGGLVNFVNTEKGQQLDQAKRDFINATLRRESGAVISPAEFDNGEKQYFPQPGEKPKAIEQKRQAREIAIRGIQAEVPNSQQLVAAVLGSAAEGAQPSGAALPPAARSVTRTGILNGRRVVQYSDGTVDYAS